MEIIKIFLLKIRTLCLPRAAFSYSLILLFSLCKLCKADAAPKRWAYDRDMQDVLRYVNPDCTLQDWLLDHPFELGKYRVFNAQYPCVPESADPAPQPAPPPAGDAPQVRAEPTQSSNAILSAYGAVKKAEQGFDLSGWTAKDGGFNGLRLGADIAGGILGGVATGLLTHKAVRDKQLKDGRDGIQCEIRGEPRAVLGEVFVAN